MPWQVEFSSTAAGELARLDPQHRKHILNFLHERIAPLENSRSIGQALHGSKFGEFWKYRVGDYRLISKIEDARVLILVLPIGHRREVYR